MIELRISVVCRSLDCSILVAQTARVLAEAEFSAQEEKRWTKIWDFLPTGRFCFRLNFCGNVNIFLVKKPDRFDHYTNGKKFVSDKAGCSQRSPLSDTNARRQLALSLVYKFTLNVCK